MASHFRRRIHREDPAEMNITAFLNLMVILVPFLLITAVFSRLAILELHIPPASLNQPQQQPDKKEFQLVVTIRQDGIEVGDTLGGLIKTVSRSAEGYNFKELSLLLQQIKIRFPDKTNVSILLEHDIPYDTLVQVMDKVRVVEQAQAGAVVQAELFPNIAIGDAPPKQ